MVSVAVEEAEEAVLADEGAVRFAGFSRFRNKIDMENFFFEQQCTLKGWC